MCAKSCRLATSGDTVGELLHELEEKMEVYTVLCVLYLSIMQYELAMT